MTTTDALETRPDIVAHTALADWCMLAAHLLRPPTPESAEALRQTSLGDDYRAITSELGVCDAAALELAAAFDALHAELAANDDALGIVRREYTRVFSHPKHPVIWPYEGVFCDEELVRSGKTSTEARLYINPAAMDAERRYKAAGYAEASMRFPADFIATELEFMGLLHTAAAKALLEGDAQGAAGFEAQLAEFKAVHCAAWMPRFFERCLEECAPGYYQLVARMGSALMAAEGVASC